MIFKGLNSILLIFCLYIFVTTNSNCANIVPPLGGPKDTIAPKIQNITPANNSLNVKTKTIQFNFDEFVQLEDATNKIVISPLPKIQPEITSKLHNVTIKLKDSLEANTTYTIQVNGAIKDVNEGNKLTDFMYTFSTGNNLDSNIISGKVIMAETGKIDSTLIVELYSNFLDSAVYKERPKYITKLNGLGEFKFINLPNKIFAIFAIADEGGQKKYTSPQQTFAFYNSQIDASTNPTTIKLFAYNKEMQLAKATNDSRITDSKIKLGNNLMGGQQDVLENLEIFSNKKLINIDTSKIILVDTNNNAINKSISIDSFKKNFTIKANWEFGKPYRLIILKQFATDEKNNSLAKNDTLKFVAKNKTEYGNATIRFSNLNLNKNPVLQIFKMDKMIKIIVLKTFKTNIPFMTDGDYELRILYDENKNGIWDTGNYFGIKKQPEIVVPISKKLTIKKDWDNELDIDESL